MTNPYDKNKAISADEAAKIIPRAEFRVFGKDIIAGVQEHMWKCKATLYAARVMPEEVYFLSRRTNEANVKVRDGLLDIKTKVGETPDGYEIFQPRGKFQFPVKREELAEILKHLEVPLELTKDVYSLEEFIEMAKKNSDLGKRNAMASQLKESSANMLRFGSMAQWWRQPAAKARIMKA